MDEIINSATPLEMGLSGIHPRLYATEERIAECRAMCQTEPWRSFLERVCAVVAPFRVEDVASMLRSGDIRGAGCALAHLAVAYRMTEDSRYLDAARDYVAAMCAVDDWGYSLEFGHWAHGMAVAYDWLYAEFDEPARERIRATLLARASFVAERWHGYGNAYPLGYAWNHAGVVHGGMMAAACAIFGDGPGAAPLVNFCLEKLRLMVAALGPDGASAEGLAYGQYHLDFHLKSLLFADQLLGEDFFAEHAFLKAYPAFMLYSALSRDAWQPRSVFMQFGDSPGSHWYGPDSHLRVVAGRYRDGHAQWLADAIAEAGVAADSSCFLNLLYYDASVKPAPPDDLPLMRHLEDKGIVLMRSRWTPGASVAGIKCGPSAGYHAVRHFRQNVAGGHMHPDAGTVLLHAHGEWLLNDGGYSMKLTRYRNTILVNGEGQTGEGGVWFEDLEMRRGKLEGRILLASTLPAGECVIADAAPAYEPAAGLRRFLRHLLFIRPDLWILADELQVGTPSVFEQRFHSPLGFVAAPDGRDWRTTGEKGRLSLSPLGPTSWEADSGMDAIRDCPDHGATERRIGLLCIRNPTPTDRAIFLTVLQAHAASRTPSFRVERETPDNAVRHRIRIESETRTIVLEIAPWQDVPETPVFTLG